MFGDTLQFVTERVAQSLLLSHPQLWACGSGMRSMARNASEFGSICGRRSINRMLFCRVPKLAIHEVNLRQRFKGLWRQTNLSPKKREWLLASNYRPCIGAVARKTDVLHGRVQLRWVVGGVRIVAESTGYVGGFMNVLV